MAGIKKLKVLLLIDKSFGVGELILSGRKIYFQYFNEFLKTGLNLSPMKPDKYCRVRVLISLKIYLQWAVLREAQGLKY